MAYHFDRSESQIVSIYCITYKALVDGQATYKIFFKINTLYKEPRGKIFLMTLNHLSKNIFKLVD